MQNRIFVESVTGAGVKFFQCEENDFQSHTNLIIAVIMTTAKAEQLSKEDEERLKDLFHKLDRNKDGQIDIDDLSAVFKSSSKSVASQTKVKPLTNETHASNNFKPVDSCLTCTDEKRIGF